MYHRERHQSAGCRNCGLCKNRHNVVLFRGSLPCDILFIGEAPGESEDALGIPFVGDSGRLLDKLYSLAWDSHKAHQLVGLSPPKNRPKMGITNIVACIPRTYDDYSSELRPPAKEEAAACQPRFLEILGMADPKAIVLLGDTAKRFFPKLHNSPDRPKRWDGKLVTLVHPAAILRQDSVPHAELMSKKFIMSLSEVMHGL